MMTMLPHKGLGMPVAFELNDDKVRNDRNIGMILITTFDTKLALIWSIYVWPKYRRRGYATTMVKYLQGELHKDMPFVPGWKGYDAIKTQWSASPNKSREMLKKLGFKKIGNELVWQKSGT